ncbi:Fe-S cluster assembly protein SufD [Cohaesibacter sp. ES.047]|uniref:Fe-S cluster assembly protein SufD n=1 Tax=Cohaesibacter sp. ES.047 TaxID=1798205 RepID=UPI000BB73A65|nr:Fe-S cluster assembly protein SufD [Cohaesibacter sp. ES.047]SNY93770.1 Fe-S cluster assembly protein SufD [Cohaesibacter sp. ES.047]
MVLPVVKTASDEAMESVLKTVQSELPGTSGFAALRSAAASKFSETGLPNKRVEEWKYSDLKRVMPANLALAGPVDDAKLSEQLDTARVFKGVERNRLVIANGAFRPDLSDLDALGDKVRITSVSDALQAGQFALDAPEISDGDMALSLNTALLQDGVIIEIAEGVELDKPIEIRNVMIGGGMSTIRNRVVVAKGVHVDLLESYVGDDDAYQLNSAIDYRIADGANVNVMRMLNDGADAIHVGSTTAILGAECKFEHFTMSTGGKFVRSQAFVRFEGEFSDAELFGTTIVDGTQHSDITLFVDHAVPNCNSKEQYRTVMDDKAEGVFQGKIIVRQIAQKTDGQMMSQALLLSEDAAFYNKPELEIYADDVICAHGATCGELDEDLLFYLKARGIPADYAKKMLVLAFLAEAIENVSNEQFVEALEGYVAERLGVEY